jgi:hypothetical protein
LFLLRRRWPELLATWLSYMVILAPTSGIIRFSDQIAADRYSYIATLCWVVLAAAGLCRLCRTSSQARSGAVGIIALCLGAILVPITWNLCRTWRDSEALYARALEHGAGSNHWAYNNCASIMASCSEATYRDGKRAVELATCACELTDWNRSAYLDTLAAAYAETGDFDAAVRWQLRAIEFLSDERQKDNYRRRLVLYQAGKPYREVFQLLAPTEARP